MGSGDRRNGGAWASGCRSLAAAGANLVVHDLAARRDVADILKSRFGVDTIGIAADLSRRAAIEAMMGDLLARLDGIDILVNNAVVRHFAARGEFLAGTMGRGAGGQSVRALPPRASCCCQP